MGVFTIATLQATSQGPAGGLSAPPKLVALAVCHSPPEGMGSERRAGPIEALRNLALALERLARP